MANRKFYSLIAGIASTAALAGDASAQTIYNYIGSTLGSSPHGTPVGVAKITRPTGVRYHSGDVFFGDAGNEIVKKVSAGALYSVAGVGLYGFSGDGSDALLAEIHLGGTGGDIAFDAIGNLYFSDIYNNRVRMVDTGGIITTIAGGGATSPGDGGPATDASISRPMGLAFDASGNLYFAEENGHRIRKVNISTGNISTIAGDGTGASTGDGAAATAAQVEYPEGIAVNADGDIFFSEYSSNKIRKISAATGNISTYATGFDQPALLDFDQAGNLFVGSFNSSGRVLRVKTSGVVDTVAGNGTSTPSGDAGPATSAGLGRPMGVSVTPGGNLLISTNWNHRIRVVMAQTVAITGTGTVCAGSTTPLTASIPGAIWKSADAAIATVSSTGVVTGVAAGTTTITYVAGLLFGSTVVTVNAPTTPVISASGTTLSVPTGYASYQWTLGGTAIAGATSESYTATTSGTYAVEVTDGSGCSATSADYVLTTTAVGEADNTRALRVFPNPAENKQFSIELPETANGNINIVVTNMVGEKVYETIQSGKSTVAVKLNAPAGIYLVEVKTQTTQYRTKVTIQ
ncbi:MAG: T9SS type A sorting domain-containing protein [Taibaiella sp.]|nr:T9SS type A sorting domain-containing protein [Taibaiella sp.]